ncbi:MULTISPECIES: pantoate--beta-alanine ligase [unclassified Rathayibacter]|uniref:pantoate--beta-alanine ligase n=1 Tax=unclassified Rathayibacter TaxID=2609250 RepID=UPI000F4BD1C3|nr:pantothenate synthetase [Rathayibacter sp. PhB186]ROS49756.1 pantothenate synthetase [Rathayibacter sp. PhB185]
MISTIERIGELRETLQEARRGGARIALVPTMGALHDGHLALVDRAREIADVVVVSIFVNPLQFGPDEDLDRYPRDLAADVALLEERGVAHVFAPSVAEMYPDGPSSTRVVAGKVGALYEGRSRPGHFDGMLTVVSKLLHIVQPDVAMFGQKDAQQLFLVRRMVRDLDLPVAIEGVDTVREEDGLALSSRNRYLDARERRAARTIPLLLEAAASAADRGIDAVIAAAQSASMGEPLVKLDYLVVTNPATLLPVDDDHRGPALVLVAAVVGSTRLLDNGPILLA